MTRGLREGALSAAGAVALVGALVAVDDRVRQHVLALADGRRGAAELSGFGDRLQDLASIALVAVREQTLDHAPLVVFALAAIVLVMFMLRT